MSGVNNDLTPWNNWDLRRIAEGQNIPSNFPGRTKVMASGVVNPAASGALYTVTAGKKLNVTCLQVFAWTSAAVANSYVTVRDGNTAVIRSVSTFTSSAAANLQIPLTSLIEPMEFLTSVYLLLDVGTYSRISYTIVGWEENV